MCIPDNYDLWAKHDAEQQEALERLPECGECGNHIQDEYCYEINGEYICPDCMSNHRKWVDDIVV